MEAYEHILLLLLTLVVFLFSLCGLLHRLRRQRDEYLLALERSQFAQPAPKEIEVCTINIEKENKNLDLPPKYDDIEKGAGKYGGIAPVHHI